MLGNSAERQLEKSPGILTGHAAPEVGLDRSGGHGLGHLSGLDERDGESLLGIVVPGAHGDCGQLPQLLGGATVGTAITEQVAVHGAARGPKASRQFLADRVLAYTPVLRELWESQPQEARALREVRPSMTTVAADHARAV